MSDPQSPAGGTVEDEPPPRAVVLDDDPVSRKILRAMLEKDGVHVDTFSDAELAFVAMETRPPDVLVLDWFMPGRDGPDVLKDLRRSPVLQTVYTILVTAHDEAGRKVTGLLLGADDFLAKPVSEMELQARVRVGVRMRRIEQQFSLLTMAATLGHEINNPLTGVLGYLEILEEAMKAGDRARAAESLDRVRTSAERIREVVKRLMQLKQVKMRRYSTGRFALDLAQGRDDTVPPSP